MRIPIILPFLLFLGLTPLQAKISIAFLGVNSDEEPLLSNELERQITKELRSIGDYSLKPATDIDLLFEKGILVSPEVGSKRSATIAKTLGSRILSFANLNRMEMDYDRTWYKPWRGTVKLSHSMWFKIIDALDGTIKYSGMLKVNSTIENNYLGWEPTIGKLDPVVRNYQLGVLMNSLAKDARGMLIASIKGLEEQKDKKEKAYDAGFFEKQRKEKKQKEGKSLKSSTKYKKKRVYKKSLFKPAKKKKKQPEKEEEEVDDLKEFELKDDELESIEEDVDLLEDVNLMEGM